MPSPVSQLNKFYQGIINAPPLKQWKLPSSYGCPVYLGSKFMAKTGEPPRVVMFPGAGSILVARKHDKTIRDVDRVLLVHLWGVDFDQLEELEARFFQSLDYQAIGGLPSSAGTIPGTYWQATEEKWDTTEDVNKRGEEVYVVLTAINSIEKVAQTFGTVLTTSLSGLFTTLTTSMASNDTTANANTANLPSSGILLIDAEQIAYTGTTATSFTGLVRGINGTTPATHSNGAQVNVS